MQFPMCASRTFTNIKITYFLNKRGIQTEIYYRREEDKEKPPRGKQMHAKYVRAPHLCKYTRVL